jgi:hypothetical protein
MSEEYKTKWQQFGKVWETGRLEVMDEIFDPEITYHMPPFPDMDLESLKGFISAFCTSFPEFQLTTHEEIIEGYASVHRWSCIGKYTGESPIIPVAPTGKSTTASGCLVFHWEGGKAVEVWHFGDWLGWLQGAGVLPPLG